MAKITHLKLHGAYDKLDSIFFTQMGYLCHLTIAVSFPIAITQGARKIMGDVEIRIYESIKP